MGPLGVVISCATLPLEVGNKQQWKTLAEDLGGMAFSGDGFCLAAPVVVVDKPTYRSTRQKPTQTKNASEPLRNLHKKQITTQIRPQKGAGFTTKRQHGKAPAV